MKQSKQNYFGVKYANRKNITEKPNKKELWELKELRKLKEGNETDIHLNSQRATQKKVQNGKIPGHDGFWF